MLDDVQGLMYLLLRILFISCHGIFIVDGFIIDGCMNATLSFFSVGSIMLVHLASLIRSPLTALATFQAPEPTTSQRDQLISRSLRLSWCTAITHAPCFCLMPRRFLRHLSFCLQGFTLSGLMVSDIQTPSQLLCARLEIRIWTSGREGTVWDLILLTSASLSRSCSIAC